MHLNLKRWEIKDEVLKISKVSKKVNVFLQTNGEDLWSKQRNINFNFLQFYIFVEHFVS